MCKNQITYSINGSRMRTAGGRNFHTLDFNGVTMRFVTSTDLVHVITDRRCLEDIHGFIGSDKDSSFISAVQSGTGAIFVKASSDTEVVFLLGMVHAGALRFTRVGEDHLVHERIGDELKVSGRHVPAGIPFIDEAPFGSPIHIIE